MNLIKILFNTKNKILAFLFFCSLIVPFRNQFYNYKNHFIGDAIEHFIYVFLVIFICNIIVKKIPFKISLISYFIILLLFVGFFSNYISLLLNLILFFFIFTFGSYISTKFTKANSLLLIFCCGYSFLGFLFYIPYLVYFINLKYYFILIFFALMAFSLFYVIKNYKILIENNKDEVLNFKYDYLLISLLSLILLSSAITDFLWDELNSGLFYPLKAVVTNYNPLTPELPTALTFTSSHFISFLSFHGFLANVNNYEIVYFYKHFQSLCYVTAFFFFYQILWKILKDEFYVKLCFYIVATSSLWFFEITGNFSDYPVILLCIYCVGILYRTNAIRQISNLKLEIYDLIIFGLFFTISVKSIIVIFAFIFLDFLNNFSIKRCFSYSLSVFFFLPAMIRNYILTQNPFFPQFNNLFKSDFFPYGLKTGAIGAKWMPNWSIDWTLMMNFFSNSNRSLQIFAHPHEFLYSPIFYVLVIFCLFIFFFRLGEFKSNPFVIFGGITFFGTVFLINAEVRYLQQSFIFCTIALIFILKDFQIIDHNKIVNQKIFSFLLIFMISIFPISNFSGSDMYIDKNEKRIYSKKGKDWQSKIKFYEKIKPILNENVKEDESILIHYLQDKIFLIDFKVIENDWYSHTDIKDYRAIWTGKDKVEIKVKKSQKYFCNEKKVKYLVLSHPIEEYFLPIVQKITADKDHFSYKINCNEY